MLKMLFSKNGLQLKLSTMEKKEGTGSRVQRKMVISLFIQLFKSMEKLRKFRFAPMQCMRRQSMAPLLSTGAIRTRKYIEKAKRQELQKKRMLIGGNSWVNCGRV